MIASIKELLNLNWEMNLSHTLREGNTCADFLAQFGSRNDIKMKIWNHLLEGFTDFAQFDASRMMHPLPWSFPNVFLAFAFLQKKVHF
jgi:hypothetical protein